MGAGRFGGPGLHHGDGRGRSKELWGGCLLGASVLSGRPCLMSTALLVLSYDEA